MSSINPIILSIHAADQRLRLGAGIQEIDIENAPVSTAIFTCLGFA
jgi:hypothetical protein